MAVELPERTETVDRYLETVYYIAGEGETVRPSRIADWLQVSAPTVSVALQRIARDGWIEIAPNRSVTLTKVGEEAAAKIVQRHRLLERWLTDVLDFDWAAADIEAERLSGSVSNDVLERIDESMNRPATCPHGNVIPGRKPPYGVLVALADLPPDTVASVRRISEIAEHEARPLLRQLGEWGVHTGTKVSVSAIDGVHDSIDVSIGKQKITLSTAVARLIWVEEC